ncbi:hypothetical protein J6590_051738 [Homalodisca vitripennis]|nr:hypothetical protein J6590_051738 [Homalodisca vitripennis]
MHLKIFHPNLKLTLKSSDVQKSNYTDVQQPAKKFFVCQTCDQYFLYKYMLEAHEKRMHTKEQAKGYCEGNENLKEAESHKTSKEEIWFEMGQTENEPYYCRICEKSYTSRNYFLLHKRIHLEQEQHVCTTCGMAFSLRKRLIRHQRVHLNIKPYKCDICHKDFTSAGALKKHGFSHLREKPFVCQICNRGFSQKVTLDFHASQHPGSTMPYLCYVCGESFYWLSLLLKHEYKVHGVNHGENGRSCGPGSLPQLDDSNMNVFVCDICKQCFKRKNSLLKHYAKFHSKKPSIASKMQQKIHMNGRSREKLLQFFCTQCNKGFSCENDLKTHDIVHTDQCPFVCKFCDKGFKFKSFLISHERVHTCHRPFICKICGKDFTQKTALTIHERVHTGHRPYICTLCGDSFKQINSLNNHVQVIHVKTPFICDTCGKLFYSRTNIKRHVQIHLEENMKTSKRK